MPYLLADFITVTHFCPVYLSKISIVFKAFKIPFVELFVDSLVFHLPIVLVEACIGFRWNNEFSLKTFYLHIKVCIQVFHLIWIRHLFHFLLHFIQQGAVLLLFSSYQQWHVIPLILQSPNSIIALITWLHVTGIVYQILFDWPHQFQLFVRSSKLISFGMPFLLHSYTFLGWISWIMIYFIIYDYSILDGP